MSGLEDMNIRLEYSGGNAQINRMNKDKLKSLKKALLYSYQSATAILADGREFRCLINPDHLKTSYDDKIISIPFEDICLNDENKTLKKTSNGIQKIEMKAGDVFTWKENNSDWLVYLQNLEETAYFRAEIRRCRYTVLVDDVEYKCYAARAGVNEIDWHQEQEILWTEPDYTLQMYITKDEKTEAFFHRYSIIKVNNKPWEVQAVDSISTDGIIILYLKEWYQNSIAEAKEKEDIENKINASQNLKEEQIIGPTALFPYDTAVYTTNNINDGSWIISSKKVKIIEQNESMIKIQVITGRSGEFELIYKRDGKDDIVYNVKIQSL